MTAEEPGRVRWSSDDQPDTTSDWQQQLQRLAEALNLTEDESS